MNEIEAGQGAHLAGLIGDAWDPGEFRRANPDRRELDDVPDDGLLAAYVRHAAALRLNPSPSFDEAAYRSRNPDVDRAVESGAFLSGWHHYLEHGRNERRPGSGVIRFIALDMARATVGAPAEALRRCFDPDLYRMQAFERFGAVLGHDEALAHFVSRGMRDGLVPGRGFDEAFYLAYYADVRKAVAEERMPSGFAHYVLMGAEEGRAPEHRLNELLRAKLGDLSVPVGLERLPHLAGRLAGTPVILDEHRQPFLNVFVPSLDPDIMFGGYIAFLHFLCRLRESGRAIRFVVLEDDQSNREWFTYGISSRPRWIQAFADAPFVNASNGGGLACSPYDRCIAYSTWTAYAAASVARKLKHERIAFFIQEDETIFHENDSLRFLVEAAYALPHAAVFNSPLLEAHFRAERRGVFGRRGSGSFLTFQHALAHVSPPAPGELETRTTRRLLFYARPERHAARNLFEIGILSINLAIERGVFGPEWEFFGIGTLGEEHHVPLADGRSMLVESRIPQHLYEERLRSFDVGLSLMWAPHPSVLPFELANAGVVTVTNEYRARDREALAAFGHNMVPCEASIDGIADGLEEAVARSRDVGARTAGRLEMPTDWDQVFDPDFIERFNAMLPAR